MAELFAIAGISITVPAILSTAASVLKAAYDIYGQVSVRKEQLKILLGRCCDLIQRVAEILEKERQLSETLTEGVQSITRSVGQCIGFAIYTWCLQRL